MDSRETTLMFVQLAVEHILELHQWYIMMTFDYSSHLIIYKMYFYLPIVNRKNPENMFDFLDFWGHFLPFDLHLANCLTSLYTLIKARMVLQIF